MVELTSYRNTGKIIDGKRKTNTVKMKPPLKWWDLKTGGPGGETASTSTRLILLALRLTPPFPVYRLVAGLIKLIIYLWRLYCVIVSMYKHSDWRHPSLCTVNFPNCVCLLRYGIMCKESGSLRTPIWFRDSWWSKGHSVNSEVNTYRVLD